MSLAETIKSWLSGHRIKYGLVPNHKTFSSHAAIQPAHVMDDHVAEALIVKNAKGYTMALVPVVPDSS